MKNSYFPHLKEKWTDVLESLVGQKVVVIGHVRPDGDCIGSQVALCRVLRQSGIDAIAVNAHPVPLILKPFVGDTPFYLAGEINTTDRIAITVDCADETRIGDSVHEHHPSFFLNIDHHVSNARYSENDWIEDKTSATAEILAGIFLDNGLMIDPVTAAALYIGIATDTGQFRFSSTSGQVFAICSDLVACGIDPGEIARVLYENESREKLALLQRFLSSFQYECKGRVCIGILPNGVFEDTGANKEDTEGLVDYARAIEGVEIGVLVEEREGAIKGSFRAKDAIHEVHKLARLFNGGGHACAAGFNLDGISLDDFYAKLLNVLEQHYIRLDGLS